MNCSLCNLQIAHVTAAMQKRDSQAVSREPYIRHTVTGEPLAG